MRIDRPSPEGADGICKLLVIEPIETADTREITRKAST